ncbi:uncharacterized protein BDCG_01121 [Blastomyces dermatitidis ER-3]|uniref:Uncharacterized protein n=1 Tax=Ajellomyces dermatitidis (strain ER-3 / ATCC MYA-2586) TaxID=559297 RepID=A0ABP2ELZ0_AJEDR|nr:uncharacterized protein BDCG_01121 [Blastomyces dermatitidis ER-3]EEQ84316.2 hypothetical protein BDCG_01121 [Blastomyces dermatitidis ER-3]
MSTEARIDADEALLKGYLQLLGVERKNAGPSYREEREGPGMHGRERLERSTFVADSNRSLHYDSSLGGSSLVLYAATPHIASRTCGSARPPPHLQPLCNRHARNSHLLHRTWMRKARFIPSTVPTCTEPSAVSGWLAPVDSSFTRSVGSGVRCMKREKFSNTSQRHG